MGFMQRGLWKSWAVILPLLSLLGACSGAGGDADIAEVNLNQQQDVQPEPRIDTDKLIADWADFIGIDQAEAKTSLERIGVLEKLGKNEALNQTEFSLYLNLIFEKDDTFARDVRAMNVANLQLSTAIRILRSPVGGSDPQDEQDQYVAFTEQAKALRLRAERGAEILGLLLQPAGTPDLLLDNDFAPIRNAFVAELMLPLFNVPFSDFPTLQQQTVAELLTAVSFAVEGKFLSFYSFTGFTPEEEDSLVNSPTPIIRTTRGTFKILEARNNTYLFSANSPIGNPGGPNNGFAPGDGSDDSHWGHPGRGGRPPYRRR